MVLIYYGNEGKKKNLVNDYGLNFSKDDVKQMTSEQMKIFNEEGEKEYNVSGTKSLINNDWIKQLYDNNIYLIEYGNNWKLLEEITEEDIEEINNKQREKLYFLGNKKYGRDKWTEKKKELDPYIINNTPEWDVENYDINDLYDLLDLEKEEILTLDLTVAIKEITNSVEIMKDALDKNSNNDNEDTIEKYKKFFKDVGIRLKDSIMPPIKNHTQVTDNFLQKPHINKIKRTVISCAQTIIINSEIDVKIPPRTTICPDDTFEYKLNRYQKTNFEVFLEFELSDTTRVILGDVIIPLSGFFPIDPAYNTNTFNIKDNSNNTINCIEIEPQKPNPIDGFTTFIKNFNDSLESVNIYDLSLNYNTTNERFELLSDSIKGYTINWVGGDCDIVYCDGERAPTAKERPVSTLGYLMGFDTELDINGEALVIIKKDLKAQAKRGADRILGPSMFYLQYTDYTNTSINHNKVNISKPIQNFKQSYYFNSIRNRVGIDNSLNFCETNLETNKRKSRKGTANNNTFNDLDTLTQAQKYSTKSNHAANKVVDENNYTYTSKTSSKIIRFPIPATMVYGGPGDKLTMPIKFNGSTSKICPIEYNGNTDIIKIGIALYDQNEFLIDLHGEGIIVTFTTDKTKKEQNID